MLIFRLRGPMAAWGEVAVGEIRGSDHIPTRSAILGLLCASLGIRRHQQEAIADLGAHIRIAVRVDDSGSSMQDYHTAQVPSRVTLKGNPHRTRRDELAYPREDLNTILSTREYRMDVAYTILLATTDDQDRVDEWSAALCRPLLTPYLGRKSCPLGWPMGPRIVNAVDIFSAFHDFDATEAAALAGSTLSMILENRTPKKRQVAWEPGLPVPQNLHYVQQVSRRDEIRHRGRWIFSDRPEVRAPWPEQEKA